MVIRSVTEAMAGVLVQPPVPYESSSGLTDNVQEQGTVFDDYKKVPHIKAGLYHAIQGINRGIFGVPSAKKSEIEDLVKLLESQNPTPHPTENLDKVGGCWKLIYNTITILGSKRTKLGLRDFITLGNFFQTIDINKVFIKLWDVTASTKAPKLDEKVGYTNRLRSLKTLPTKCSPVYTEQLECSPEVDEVQCVATALPKFMKFNVLQQEITHRKIAGLHLNTSIGSTDITNMWEPLEEGLLPLETTRHVLMITITLSMKELDASSI
ncbi:hypothetical protein IFM89_021992, partial [Coptis chinensis]